jgi:hypothetical protein
MLYGNESGRRMAGQEGLESFDLAQLFTSCPATISNENARSKVSREPSSLNEMFFLEPIAWCKIVDVTEETAEHSFRREQRRATRYT